MPVLVVEDDAKMATYISRGLKEGGYVVSIASDGQEGLDRLLIEDYDAAIVDIMMPKKDGISLVRELRDQGVRTPILFLSAKREVGDRVKGLRSGGDDYLVKPFAFSELLARLEAVLRRARNEPEKTLFTFGELTIDTRRREVKRNAERIMLQPREYALFEYLIRNAGRVVSKTMIMEHVWGYDFEPRTNVIEARISRLRDKVDRGTDSPRIHTVRGVGYVFRSDE